MARGQNAINKMVMAMTLVIAICYYAGGQPLKREFPGYDGHFLFPKCHTYDNAVLYCTHTTGLTYGGYQDSIQYIIKMDLAGKELWRIQLNGITPSTVEIHATKDSGLIVIGTIDLYSALKSQDNNEADSSLKAAILKFDKCGVLQWGISIANDSFNSSTNLVMDEEENMFALLRGINGEVAENKMRHTIIKVSKDVALLGTYHGNSGSIMMSKMEDKIILTGLVYFEHKPVSGNSFSFACTNVRILDLSLTLEKSAVFGFKEKSPNIYIPAFAHQGSIYQASRTVENFDKTYNTFTIRKLDEDLNQIAPTYFEREFTDLRQLGYTTIAKGTRLYWGVMQGDLDRDGPFYPTLRCYDRDLNFVNALQFPDSSYIIGKFFALRDSSAFIVMLYNERTEKSIHYLVDWDLKFIPWPKPVSGAVYDYACAGGISPKRMLNVTKIDYKYIRVPNDTSTEDWSWVYKTSIDEDGVISKQKSATTLTVYPNPAENSLQISGLPEGVGTINYSICAIDGRVEQGGQLRIANSNAQTIEINMLSKGMHILHLQYGNQRSVVKFVRQ